MPLTPIQMGTRSNPNRNDTQAQLINLYVEDLGEDNEARWALYACDGYSSFSSLVSGDVCKGMLNLDDTTLYVVTGQRINRVDTSGTATDMGALATSGYAYMARNRKDPNAQIAIVTSDGLFRIIENNVVSSPSVDPDVGAELFNSVAGIDGYFVITKSNGEWYITSIDEGTAIDDLEFAQANSSPDGISRAIVRGRDVLICGPRSIEAYQNTGAADFPFERVEAINIGLAYAPAIVNLAAVIDGGTQDVVIFPGNNADGSFAGVMVLSGYSARTISPNALDRAIRDEPTKSSIRAFTYARNGHVFYCITGSSFTWEYNASTGFWHQRKSSGQSRWNVVDAVHFDGKTIFADASAGTLYQGNHSLTPASASNVILRHSNDGGASWSPARTKSIGTTKTRRIRFPSLGTSKEDGKVFELTFSNAVVENGTGTDAVIYTPPVHAFPRRMIFDALYVNATSGVSQSSSAKGFINLAVDATAVEA